MSSYGQLGKGNVMQTKTVQTTHLHRAAFLIGDSEWAPICLGFQDSDPDKVELDAVDHMYRECEQEYPEDSPYPKGRGVIELLDYEDAFKIGWGIQSVDANVDHTCQLNPNSGLLEYSGYKAYTCGIIHKDLQVTLALSKTYPAFQNMAASAGYRQPVMYLYTKMLGLVASRPNSPLLSTFYAMLYDQWAMEKWTIKNLEGLK